MNNTFYTDTHLKLSKESDTFIISFSEYAITKLGNIMFLNLPEEGDEIETGDAVGDVESIKTVTDIISPVSGEVIEVNEKLLEHPEQITLKPQDSWLFKVRVKNEPDGLMSGEEYNKFTEGL